LCHQFFDNAKPRHDVFGGALFRGQGFPGHVSVIPLVRKRWNGLYPPSGNPLPWATPTMSQHDPCQVCC
jgi:hypothetical protein